MDIFIYSKLEDLNERLGLELYQEILKRKKVLYMKFNSDNEVYMKIRYRLYTQATGDTTPYNTWRKLPKEHSKVAEVKMRSFYNEMELMAGNRPSDGGKVDVLLEELFKAIRQEKPEVLVINNVMEFLNLFDYNNGLVLDKLFLKLNQEKFFTILTMVNYSQDLIAAIEPYGKVKVI